MKKLFMTLSLVTLMATASWGRGGETQNGAGAAEQNFAYALTLLKPLYRECLASESCLRIPAQKAVLKMIYENVDGELKSGSPLRFIPGADSFKIDGQVRIAFTDLQVGALIFINQDLIYSNRNGQVVPYSVSEAISVLTHELGHHVPLLGEHDFLDSLGAQVRAYFEQERQEVIRETFLDTFSSSKISLSLLHSSNSRITEKTWLNVDGVIHNTDEILKGLNCVGLQAIENMSVKSARLFDMRWSEEMKSLGEGRQELSVEGQALVNCAGKYFYGAVRYRVKIVFVFDQVVNGLAMKFVYEPHSVRVEAKEYQ